MPSALPPMTLAHARRFAWPIPDLWSSASLSPDDLRSYWHFRRSFMDLKPHVDPEEDYERFAAWVRGSHFVWLPRDRDGRLLATTALKVETRLHEGQECVILRTEYVFASPALRKSAGAPLALVLAMCLGAWRRPGRPMYLVGPGYLPSFVALAQVFDRAWVRDDDTMSPWEQSLWRALALETKGYDPATRLIAMDTVPIRPRLEPPRDPAVLGRYQEYLAHNPRWTEGYCCLVCVRIGQQDIAKGLRMLARRMRRRR